MPNQLDLDLQPDQISRLTSADAIAAFLHDLGYPTGKRRALAPGGLALGGTEPAVTHAEVLSEDEDGFLRVVFARLRSVTAKARADLVRAFARDAVTDHMLILTSDFDTLEFVLIDKEQRQRGGVRREVATVARPRVFVVPRRWPHQSLRILRRLTYTMDDGLRQFDKLRSVFDAAHFSGTYFTNRALFADHYLETRLKEDQAWGADPGPAFQSVRRLVDAAPDRIGGKPLDDARREFYDPIWSILGFRAATARGPTDGVEPDYKLTDGAGRARTVALVYPWLRWLDGPDPNDPDRPDENPGAAVVSLLERGEAEWAIVTNGKHWRLYSRAAHSRSTNFYEVDLQDALLSSGLSDPNEAFRYWWLFFRLEAFLPVADDAGRVWLDAVADGSRDYAREVEAELKRRVFYDVVPMLAQGFLHDRRRRLKRTTQPSEAELERIRHGTLTLLYRILFLLYAESRDLLPVREDPYYRVSLKKLKEEIAQVAGVAQSEADAKLDAHYSKLSTDLYDRLSDPKAGLFAAMASGRSAANVPRYNGGLFRLDPAEAADEHEADVCTFLNEHKVPDAFLAAAIDRLARVENPRTCTLEFVDYKSLGVRQLGSIYEGLLEFRLGVATEDVAVVRTKAKIEHIPLTRARGGRGRRRIEREYRKGEPLLIKDKAERKATGSYYTPDHIVEYIVEHTVGPVLKRKLDALRPEFRKAEKAFHRWLANAEADPRIMLGWRPAWGPTLAGEAGKPTERDRRRFALEKAYDEHKGLVDRLFDLKVLDPAMGSGHFLVEAVDFITDELLDFLNAFPVNPVSAALERTREAILESLRGQGIETDEFLRRQLTDVHLLKRHVLKRCIYGVDLNPLATELAKVSLWLDAFTLGAPLSFLDHHLRTGNSLIGASLPELEMALEGQLFRIDESHLHRAVQNVLTVARLADATASEVAESKRAFDEARRTLSGYGVLLDILVAKHFGHGAATSILQHGSDLDLSSREAFFESLNSSDRRLVSVVEALAKDRRFFHWDLEFPEVFYTFAGLADGRVERLPEGEAGFDAIVGNPPYVRQEAIKRDKAFLAASYAPIFDAANDLFVYFMFREVELLRAADAEEPAGLMSMIVANKWLRAGYGVRLRRYLARTSRPVSIVDFGHSPIFPDADTFPCVPIFARRRAALNGRESAQDGEAMVACRFPREEYDPAQPIAPNVRRRGVRVPTALLRDDGWTLDDPREQLLLDKLRQMGSPLKDIVGDVPRRGIVSGLNEAFYIDAATRERLIAEDPASAELILPLIRGRHIARWVTRPTSDFILMVRRGTPITKLPAIRKHLLRFKDRLEPRPRDWDEKKRGKWPGRAAGQYKWFELQGSPGDDFVDLIRRPKIVYQEIQFHSWFALDTSGSCINNKAFLLPTDDLALLGVLSSPLMWWVFTRTLPHMKDEALSPSGYIMENVRLELGSAAQQRSLTAVVRRLIEQARTIQRFEAQTIDTARERLRADGADERIVVWLALSEETFASRVRRLGGNSSEDRVVAFQREARAEQVRLLEAQRDLERELATLVEDIYALTPEERRLLRETRPVRDPLDVLDGLIAGRAADSPAFEETASGAGEVG